MNLFTHYAILLIMTLMLTGCPLMDRDLDKRYPTPDISAITLAGDDVCMAIPYPSDYSLRMIAINPRGSDPKTWWFRRAPDLNLKIKDGKICIPPAFYTFKQHQQYVIQTILWSDKKYKETDYGGRIVIAAFEIDNDHAYRVVLEARET